MSGTIAATSNMISNYSNPGLEELVDSFEHTTQLVKQISYGYVSPVIISVGIVGDVMTLVVLSHASLRRASVVYAYLFYLALTDLLTLLSVIPMISWIVYLRTRTVYAAFYYAHIGFPLVNALMGSSVFIVVSLTLSQYIAVCYPLSSTFRSRRMCNCLVAAAYCISFLANSPWCAKFAVNEVCLSSIQDESSTLASYAPENKPITSTTWYKALNWVRELIVRFFPFIVVAFFNIRIMTTYRTMRKHRFTVISSQQRVTIRRKTNLEERRLMSMLVVIIFIFFVCTIPAAFLSSLISESWEHSLRLQIFRAVANILEFTKFALNFYFYCMINPDIRQLCKKRLLCQSYEGFANGKFRNNSFVGASMRVHSPSAVVNRDRSRDRSCLCSSPSQRLKYFAANSSCCNNECNMELTANVADRLLIEAAATDLRNGQNGICHMINSNSTPALV